jgi:hypothetical protein
MPKSADEVKSQVEAKETLFYIYIIRCISISTVACSSVVG